MYTSRYTNLGGPPPAVTASRVPDPGCRLVPVDASRRRAFELAVSDASDDPVGRPFLRRVTERRIGYVEECYRALGLSPEEAGHRALMAYAAYVGTVRLFRDVPDRAPRGEEYRVYRRRFIEALVPGDDADGTRAR